MPVGPSPVTCPALSRVQAREASLVAQDLSVLPVMCPASSNPTVAPVPFGYAVDVSRLLWSYPDVGGLVVPLLDRHEAIGLVAKVRVRTIPPW